MGLFDIFKKKAEPVEEVPVENNLNSIFTMKFVVPYFSIFDKTNPQMANFPIRVAVGGSVQYRIADPNMCFNNVRLGQMSPSQLEEHVKDGLIAVVKAFLNQISTIPVLQFESTIMKLNHAARDYVIPTFLEEYGINFRTFNMSRITYDTEDPNYAQLQRLSRSAVSHMAEKQDSEHKRDLNRDRIAMEIDNREIIHADLSLQRERNTVEADRQREINAVEMERKRMELEAREMELHLNEDIHRRRESEDLVLQRERNAVEMERKRMELETERQKLHLNEDIHERRVSTDTAAKNGALNIRHDDGLKFDLDDNEFKIDGL